MTLLFFSQEGFSQAPNFSWVQQAGGTGYDCGTSVVADEMGNSFVTGRFYGTATFGTTTLASIGNYDIFLARYDATGSLLWVRQAGGSGYDSGNGIAIDGSGNIIVTGRFYGTAAFGSITITSTGSFDIFIAKYDGDGKVLWAKNAGGTSSDIAYGITADARGNCSITGYFQGTATFGNVTLAGVDKTDIFVARYNSTGDVVWVKRAGASGHDYGYSITRNQSGALFITGYFEDTISFESIMFTSAGARDFFIAKYDSAGSIEWARQAGSKDSDIGYGIGTDGAGNSYATGSFQGNINFDSYALTGAGGADIFIVKYDPFGTVLWARQAGGSSSDYGQGITTDNSGNSTITGYFFDTARFGATTLMSAGGRDIFIAQYDAVGNMLWAESAGGTEADYGNSIAMAASGNGVLTGNFAGRASFGSNLITSVGDNDIFIARLGQPLVSQEIFIEPNRLNLISFHVTPQNPDAAIVFGAIANLVIVTDDDGNVYLPPDIVSPGHPGTNTIGTIATSKGYSVFCNAADSQKFQTTGFLVDRARIQIDLAPLQLNKIAFPASSPIAITDVFSSTVNTHVYNYLVEVHDDEGHYFVPPGIAYPGHAGTNTIGTMKPGKGYALFHNSDSMLSFNYPGTQFQQFQAMMPRFAAVSPVDHFNFIKTGEPHPVFLENQGLSLQQGDELGLYVNDLCIGAMKFDGDLLCPLIAWQALPVVKLPGVNNGDMVSMRRYVSASQSYEILALAGDVYFDGNRPFSVITLTGGTTGTPARNCRNPGIEQVTLYQNFPNPFNPSTTIRYELEQPSLVNLAILDIQGQIVKILVNQFLPAGTHAVTWDGSTQNNMPVATGIYFYRLLSGKFEKVGKMVVVK